MIVDKIKYSIIIPVHNEEKLIPLLLNDIESQRKNYTNKTELIIVDGGSRDNTMQICNSYDTKIIKSELGRGKQLIEGVKNSSGKVLIFLHADLQIPQNMFVYLDNNFDKKFNLAVFRMKLDKNKMLYKFYSFFTRFDSIFSTFGDQGIIVRRDFYNEIGGFKDFPIMEDVDLFRRARKIEKIKKLKKHVIVSSRRFESVGIFKTQIKSLVYILKFLLGTNPRVLHSKYYYNQDERRKGRNHFRQIPGIREGENTFSLSNE